MKVCLGKDKKCADKDLTDTHAMGRDLCRSVQGVGHKLYMDNFFSSPDLFDDLTRKKISSCRTVRPNHKRLPQDFHSMRLRPKMGDIQAKVRGDISSLVLNDK